MIKIEIVNQPAGFTKPNSIGTMFGGFPPEVALAMFEEMMEMQELIDNGVRCANCGELHLPDEMVGEVCSDCHFEIIVRELAKEEELNARLEAELDKIADDMFKDWFMGYVMNCEWR